MLEMLALVDHVAFSCLELMLPPFSLLQVKSLIVRLSGQSVRSLWCVSFSVLFF